MKNLLLTVVIYLFPFFSQTLTARNPSGNIPEDSLKTKENDSTKVLTGYIMQRNDMIIGSVSLLSNDKLTLIPTGDLMNQLQGLVPGLTIVSSGQPGETSMSFLRGIGTFTGSTPLFVIDGLPVEDISLLNSSDISSLAVLKDASAAAIYGGRAKNGVIVINTKKAGKGIHVSYNMATGYQIPGKGPTDELLSSKELADLQWLVYKNDNITQINPLYGPSTNSPVLPSWAANTDWYNAITKPSLIQDHNLSVSAGAENARIYIGTGFFDQNGIILNTFTKRYSAQINSELSFLDKHIRIGENMQLASRTGNYVPNLSENSPILAGPYRLPSIIPVYITVPVNGPGHNFQPGEYGGTGMAPTLGNSTNVTADRIRNKNDRSDDSQIEGQVYTDILIFKGLSWRTSYGITKHTSESIDYNYATYENSENSLTSYHTESSGNKNSWIINSLLNLEKEFGDHLINLVAGIERTSVNNGKFESTTRSGVEPGAGVLQQTNGYSLVPESLQSLFMAAGYSFREKYFLNISLRSDEATSYFVSNNHNFFPAMALGWRISKEKFLSSVDWLSDLKLRASYGKTGDIFYGQDKILTTDLGLDSRLFNNHLGLVLDWYSKKSSELIQIVDIPGTAGPGPDPHINSATMKNSGIDAKLNYNQAFGGVIFNADCYFTVYRNEIGDSPVDFFDSFAGLRIGPPVRNQEGHPLSSFYGYQVAGLFSSNIEVAGAPTQDGAQPGFFRFVNQNADNAITPADRTFLGNPHPDFTAGIHLGLSYKRFDIGALLYWVQGNEIFNYTKWWTDFWPSFNGQKSKRLLYDSWTVSNTNATVPKASNNSNFSTNTQNCSYYIEDGSYLRLKSFELGYNFDEKLLKKIRMSSFRLYLQAVNLFTITKYSGIDPEIGGTDSAFGIDTGNYPNVKQFLFGLKLEI